MPANGSDRINLIGAVEDFHAARRKAALEMVLSRVRGKPADLLSYDEVRQRLHAVQTSLRTLEDIPLDRIVGSVNRYNDFTRGFLPRQASDEWRWARVRAHLEDDSGLPPIEVYKVGDVYFVLDGNHRVSVARALGNRSIEGYVTPVNTRVKLSPGDSPDDVILKAEYADFLAATQLDETRPQSNLLVTAPGSYGKLLEHISAHRYFMGQERRTEVSFPDAAAHWYDTVYQPIEELIQQRGLLHEFPERTAADLYLWLMEYRAELSGGGLGWEVDPERASSALVEKFSPTLARRLARAEAKVFGWLVPDPLDPGPPAGAWRTSSHRKDGLFESILVAIPDSKGGSSQGPVIDLAVEVARREQARLTGLHVVKSEGERESGAVRSIEELFNKECQQAEVTGRLLVESGVVSEALFRWSRWVDLLVFRLNNPPPTSVLPRMRSGARLLIRRSSSLLLALPGRHFDLSSALLAYGGHPKAEEALYVATYLAGSWKIPLTVVSVRGKHASDSPGTLERARSYLEDHGVSADYLEEQGDPARVILHTAEQRQVGFIVMGGYEAGALRETLFGSTVDRVIRSTRRAVFICR